MKRIRPSAGILVMIFLFLAAAPQIVSAQYENANISYNDFYDNLAPYGQWIQDSRYGYVWSPNVDGSFRPYYTNGYWAMTDYGDTWISDYPWGWACFHYGRWTYDNYYGWLWIPGSNWGPAWVSWRYTEGYYGWAPLGPDYVLNDNPGDYGCPGDWWVFIPQQYIFTGNYYRYWNGPRGNTHMLRNSYFVNNFYENNRVHYVFGPHVKEIENVTHQPVQVFKLRNSTTLNTRVHNKEIKMYRPAEIRPYASTDGQRNAPANVIAAPQPIATPQSVNRGQTTPPRFRNDVPAETIHQDVPGTTTNKVAEPAKPAPRYDNNPYEWDVNRSVPQPTKKVQFAPVPDARDEEEGSRPAPRQQQPQRPTPQQQPRQTPQPQQPRQTPQPQPQPRQAPQQQPRTQPPATPQPAPGSRK